MRTGRLHFCCNRRRVFGLHRECLWSTARAKGRRDGSASGSRHNFWEASTDQWHSSLQLVTQRAQTLRATRELCALLFAREVLVARCALVYSRRAPRSCYSYRCGAALASRVHVPHSRSVWRLAFGAHVHVQQVFELRFRSARVLAMPVASAELMTRPPHRQPHSMGPTTYLQIAIYSRVRPPRFSLRRLFTTANRCHLCLRSSPGPQLPLN